MDEHFDMAGDRETADEDNSGAINPGSLPVSDTFRTHTAKRREIRSGDRSRRRANGIRILYICDTGNMASVRVTTATSKKSGSNGR